MGVRFETFFVGALLAAAVIVASVITAVGVMMIRAVLK